MKTFVSDDLCACHIAHLEVEAPPDKENGMVHGSTGLVETKFETRALTATALNKFNAIHPTGLEIEPWDSLFVHQRLVTGKTVVSFTARSARADQKPARGPVAAQASLTRIATCKPQNE
jgi:hypothetical protein